MFEHLDGMRDENFKQNIAEKFCLKIEREMGSYQDRDRMGLHKGINLLFNLFIWLESQ
jgi:hypothetical protein